MYLTIKRHSSSTFCALSLGFKNLGCVSLSAVAGSQIVKQSAFSLDECTFSTWLYGAILVYLCIISLYANIQGCMNVLQSILCSARWIRWRVNIILLGHSTRPFDCKQYGIALEWVITGRTNAVTKKLPLTVTHFPIGTTLERREAQFHDRRVYSQQAWMAA